MLLHYVFIFYAFIFVCMYCYSTAVALSEFIVRFQTDHSTVKELVDYASGIISYGFLPEEYSDVRRQLVNTVLAFASRPRSKVDVANFSFLLESENIRNNTNMSIDTINNADVPIENSTTASVTNTSTYVDSSAKSDFNVAQRNATLIRRSAKFTLISKNTSLSPSIATVSSVQKQWKRRSL